MTTVSVSPMQWATLKDIDDVEPLGEGDYACLAEIREVLKRHGKRERLGVALLHKHFDLDDDELLVEITNKEERVLTITPVKNAGEGRLIETIWMLQDDGENRAMLGCQQYCGANVQGNHGSFHRRT